MKQVFNSTDN